MARPDTDLIPNFSVMFFRWEITVVRLMCSLSAISLLINPLVTSPSTSISRALSSCSASVAGGVTGWCVSSCPSFSGLHDGFTSCSCGRRMFRLGIPCQQGRFSCREHNALGLSFQKKWRMLKIHIGRHKIIAYMSDVSSISFSKKKRTYDCLWNKFFQNRT